MFLMVQVFVFVGPGVESRPNPHSDAADADATDANYASLDPIEYSWVSRKVRKLSAPNTQLMTLTLDHLSPICQFLRTSWFANTCGRTYARMSSPVSPRGAFTRAHFGLPFLSVNPHLYYPLGCNKP